MTRGMRLTRFDSIVIASALVLVLAITFTATIGAPQDPGLRVAYLREGASRIPNIWIAAPDAPDEAEQITFSEYGIFDFAVSPDGRTIAYTERDFDTGIADIYLLDLRSGDVEQVTDCIMADADCFSPVWRPDGQVLAYERIALNRDLAIPPSPNRVWLLDLTHDDYPTVPLVDDPQVLGYDPVWSRDGNRLAFFDTGRGGILVYDFAATEAEGEAQIAFIPSDFGTTGDFSPDGGRVVFAEMLPGGPLIHAHLQVANLQTDQINVLTSPDENADDQSAAWHPDGRFIAVSRRYLDSERITPGHQVYLIDAADGSLAPLIVDRRYNHGAMQWSPDGDHLLMVRFQRLTDGGDVYGAGTLEVWAYSMADGALVRVAENAYLPAWVP